MLQTICCSFGEPVGKHLPSYRCQVAGSFPVAPLKHCVDEASPNPRQLWCLQDIHKEDGLPPATALALGSTPWLTISPGSSTCLSTASSPPPRSAVPVTGVYSAVSLNFSAKGFCFPCPCSGHSSLSPPSQSCYHAPQYKHMHITLPGCANSISTTFTGGNSDIDVYLLC